MDRGTGMRRTRTRTGVRVLGAVLAAWLVGLFVPLGADASPAASSTPYPPTTPCALSWQPATTTGASPDSSAAVLLGSGLGGHQHVRVTLYPQSRTLGAFATDSSGSFAAQVTVPTTSASSSWLTASSQVSSCSTGTGPIGPLPSSPGGGSVATPPATSGSTPAGTAAGSGQASPGPRSGRPTGGAAGSAAPTPASPAGAGSPGTSGSPTRPYPPTTRTTSRPAGSGAGSSTPGGSPTTSPSPSRPTHSTPPQSISSDSLGVPMSIIVGIAVLLVVAGGMGVLMLTRRSS